MRISLLDTKIIQINWILLAKENSTSKISSYLFYSIQPYKKHKNLSQHWHQSLFFKNNIIKIIVY